MKRTLQFSSLLFAGLIAAGVSAAYAQNNADTVSSHVLAGAFPAPPKGAGPGKLTMMHLPHGAVQVVSFGQAGTPAGNSFYVAADSSNQQLFVPTVEGVTNILDLRTGKLIRHFNSIPGGRVAIVSPDHNTVYVLSGKALAAYSTSDDTLRFQVAVGGNAMAFNTDGSHLYIGGNMNKTIADIDPATGHTLQEIPIGHTGDLAWAHGVLFSADIKSGVMSAYKPETNHIYRMATNEVDPDFTYSKIPAATAGFMQLAVSPDQNTVYAAGFSGHILRFSAADPTYLGQVKVSGGKTGPNKLSGLAMMPNAGQAITTIENRRESVVVNLHTGKVLKRMPNVASNRWVLAH
ncbi:MAG: YncE family protein [Sulfuriferula sp.]